MSHVTPIEIEIKDLEAVKAMCTRMGWRFMKSQHSYKWYGRFMRDYPLPEGFTEADLGKCDHAIRIPGASYEIGLVKRGNQYIPLFDFWSSGGLEKALGGSKAPLFKQMYGVEAAKRIAKKKGFKVVEKREKGAIKLWLKK